MAEEDLIFGKNRHLFGGIAPGDMVNFTVSKTSDTKLHIQATLPSDTIIDGQTVCSVSGALIRYSSRNYPKNEFNGQLLGDVKVSTGMNIALDATKAGYFAAFPYSTQGVYNRDPKNRCSINEPPAMIAFTAAYSGGKVSLTCTLPSGVVGAKIIRKTDGYPLHENDGDWTANCTSSGTLVDPNDVQVGVTYYYTAFPYNSDRCYNYSETNRASAYVKKYEYLYGYDINLADSNPDTRVTYPSDVDNAGFTPAYMYFSSGGGQTRALTPEGAFQYGSWPRTSGEKFMPRPCMLYNIDAGSALDGTVAYYLNQYDYTKKADGTASDISSFNGNAMMEWPKIYTKRWEENGVYHFRCSDGKVDDDYECWCNYDRNNNEIDHFYTAIYTGYNNNGRLASLSGKANFVSQTVDTDITYAKENGPDWTVEVLADRLLINDLLVMMARTTDCQTAYGKGFVDTNPNGLNTGTMNAEGMFIGSNSTISGVKVFGMENYWGNVCRCTIGLILADGSYKVKLTRGTNDGSTVTDYNSTGTGYKSVSMKTLNSDTSAGYVSGMKTESFGRLPIAVEGSMTNFECDYLSYKITGTYPAYFGGVNHNHGFEPGPFYLWVSREDYLIGSSRSATIACKPTKK